VRRRSQILAKSSIEDCMKKFVLREQKHAWTDGFPSDEIVGMIHHQFFFFSCLVALIGCGAVEYVQEDIAKGVRRALKKSVVTLATQVQIKNLRVLENSYIVNFRDFDKKTSYKFSNFRSEYRHHYLYLGERFSGEPAVKEMRFITAVNLKDPKARQRSKTNFKHPDPLTLSWGQESTEDPTGIIAEVNFNSIEGGESLLRKWEQKRLLWYAEPNYLNYPLDIFGDAHTAYSEQTPKWWFSQVNLIQALQDMANRDQSKFASDDEISKNPPIVAVLDSGLDVNHAAMQGRVWQNPLPTSDCPGDKNGCDTTRAQKGYLGVGDVKPFALQADGRCPPESNADGNRNCIHGTHVAGIVAAKFADGIGGFCPVCQVLAIKIIKDVEGKGAAPDSAILNGLKYISLFRKHNSGRALVRIVNSSFGKYSRSKSVGLVVNVLKRAPQEVLVVGAAGNEDSMVRVYPAALNDAVAVASLGAQKGSEVSQDRKSNFSNYGPWVDIAAPGFQIVSTIPGNTTGPKSGTSMAAPVVAGIAGLILAVDPGRSFGKLRSSLLTTASRAIYADGAGDGFNRFYRVQPQGEQIPLPLLGSGVIDAAAAIQNNTKSGYIVIGDERVAPGCGVLASMDGNDPTQTGVLWAMLLLPIFLRLVLGRIRSPHLWNYPCSGKFAGRS
jgi:subtilisin family serine protease